MLSQAVLILMAIWVAVGFASPYGRFGLTAKRWVAASALLVSCHLLINWFAFFWWSVPASSAILGATIGLSVVSALRVLTNTWEHLAGLCIVLLSSINIFLWDAASTQTLAGLFIAIWTFTTITLAGWWIIQTRQTSIVG
jgi:hypothetical protein